MTGQTQVETALPPFPVRTFQRPKLLRIAFAMFAGAVSGSSTTVLLLGGVPTESYMVLAWLGVALFFIVGTLVFVPLWEWLYRRGYRHWWQASVFGAVAGFGAALMLMGEGSDIALHIAAMIGIGAGVAGLVVWSIGYRPRR